MQALPVLGAGPDLLRACCGCPCRGLLPGALGGGLRAEGLRRSPGVAPAAGAPGKIGGPCCCRCPAAADAGGAGLLAGADDLRAGADGPDLGPVSFSRCGVLWKIGGPPLLVVRTCCGRCSWSPSGKNLLLRCNFLLTSYIGMIYNIGVIKEGPRGPLPGRGGPGNGGKIP